MQYIQLKEENKEANLQTLIHFYNSVWGVYEEYVENDKALYFIFDDKNSAIFSKRAKVIILNTMYSAGMKDVQKDDFVDNFDWTVSGKKYKKNGGDYRSTQLLSLESKLCHWKSEVNNQSKALPIYDNNVKWGLDYYRQDKLRRDSQNSRNARYQRFPALQKAVDEFITKYLGKEGSDVIQTQKEVEGLPNAISIYRLVDKFLWLSYKINHGKVPQNVKDAYNN